jgi:hypothetical protein
MQRSLWREMQSNTHPNEWVQYTSQPYSVVQSWKYQDEIRNFIVFDQSQGISSPQSVTNRWRDLIRGI